MSALLSVFLATLLPASPPPAVLRVGVGQPFATIGQALLAAGPGDLVLVDPGTYPAFTVSMPVTIAASGQDFVVLQGSGIAAITIVGAAGTVAIDGARIALAQLHAPAIAATGCIGDVRLANVRVDAVADLLATSARAAIEVDGCALVTLERVAVHGVVPRSGRTTNPDGANDGLCAARFADTPFVLRDCLLRGYDAPAGGMFGGDAVRAVIGGAAAAPSGWLLAGSSQTLIGGAAVGSGGNGGNCLHVLGTGLAVDLCNLHFLSPGSGSARSGGFYAINHDGGRVAPGVSRMIPACVLETVAVTAAPAVVSPGGTLPIAVTDFGGNAICIAFVCFGSVHRASMPGVSGRVLLDLAATTTIGIGLTPAAFSIAVPANPGLAGLQLTAQSAVLSPNGWPLTVTSWPAFVSVR